MPYISPTTNPAEALNGLGSAMFPDPSKMAQAQYAGAHARKAEAETSALNAQNIARNSIGQTLAAAAANPNQQTIAAAAAAALAANIPVEQVIRGGLAAHQAAGSPGGPQMAQSLVDTILTTASGGNFASTPTGFQQGQANDIKRSQIAVGPQYQKNAIESAQWNATNRYQLANGNVIALKPGDDIPAGAIPMQDATSRVNQQVSSGPNYMKEERERGTPQTFMDPRTGQTTNWRYGDPNPPPGQIPAQQGAPVLSSVLTTPPRPALVPDDSSNSGYTPEWFGPGQTPARGAVPIDPQSPQNSIGMASLFGSAPQTPAQAAPLPTAPGDPAGNVSVRTGLGGVIAPAGGPPPAPASAPPSSVSAPGALGAQTPPPSKGQTQTAPLASRLMGGTPVVTPETIKPADYKQIEAQIATSMKTFNANNNPGGLQTGATRDYQLDEEAHSEIFARAAELARTPGKTMANYPAAVEQAITELRPRFDLQGRWAPGTGPSLIKLKPAQGQTPAPAGASPTAPPSSAPMGTTPTHQEPVPAPGNVARSGPSSPLSNTMIPSAEPGVLPVPMPGPAQVAPAGAQVAQTAPQQAPVDVPQRVPGDPAQRVIGQVYLGTGGVKARWLGEGRGPNGTGWQHVP